MESIILTEQERKKYEKFFLYCAKKEFPTSEEQLPYLLGARFGTVYFELKHVGLTRFCAVGGFGQGKVLIDLVHKFLLIAREKEVYKTISDEHNLFELFSEITVVCNEHWLVGGEKTNERLESIEEWMKKIPMDEILKYFIEVYRTTWDEEGIIWKTYQLETVFWDASLKNK